MEALLIPAPRSDYFCSRCDTAHADLPIGTDACPGCGKRKWFTRVWAVNVSTSGISARKDPQLQAAYEAAMAPKEAAKAAERAKRVAPSFGVRMNEVPGVMQRLGVAPFQMRPGDSAAKRGEIGQPGRGEPLGQVSGRGVSPLLAGKWAPKE